MAEYGVYITYEEIIDYLGNPSDLTDDDTRLKNFAVEMSRKFDAECKRKFYPRLETRYFDHSYPVTEITFDDDLLQVVTFTTNNGSTTVAASDYYLMAGQSYSTTPYSWLQLKSDGDQNQLAYSGTKQQANAITGFWGFHDNWANAWAQVDQVQDNPLTISATSMTAADVDGANELGITPRLKSQQLGRFGSGTDAEYFFITATNTTTNVSTIIRGVNGTTATAQAQNTNIYVYRPPSDIVHALKVLAAHAYRRKDSIGSLDDRPLASPAGVMIMPSTMPGEVKEAIKRYRRKANLV